MDLQIGDIQETALITLAIRASETDRPNARIKDLKAKEIIDTLGVDVSQYDPFMSHEGVVARTIMYSNQLKELLSDGQQTAVVRRKEKIGRLLYCCLDCCNSLLFLPI